MNQTGVREQLIFLQLYLTTRQLSWEACHLSSSFGAILYFLVLNNYNVYCWHLSSKSSLSLLSVSRFDKSNQLEGLGVALGFLHVARSKTTDQSGKMQFIYNKAFLKTGGPTVGTCWRGCTCLIRPHWTPYRPYLHQLFHRTWFHRTWDLSMATLHTVPLSGSELTGLPIKLDSVSILCADKFNLAD